MLKLKNVVAMLVILLLLLGIGVQVMAADTTIPLENLIQINTTTNTATTNTGATNTAVTNTATTNRVTGNSIVQPNTDDDDNSAENDLPQTGVTEDITVYRAFSISNEEELMPLSKANLVSTSLNINECSKYLIPNKDYTHYLYQINLEKGSMVTICPYRILIDNNDRLTLTKENGSEEIIISKDNYDFEEVMETTTEFTDNEELNIISVNAIFKVKDTKLKR